jgi:hypothetical protein
MGETELNRIRRKQSKSNKNLRTDQLLDKMK